VEVAAYRIVLEAVNNAVHHGKARHCRIAVRVEDGLTIEVADDGEGLPAEMDPGVGITSMRERSMELGGRFQIASLPEGGTRVSVWLPTGEGEA
jgi:two-component system NarL family sensor kinase